MAILGKNGIWMCPCTISQAKKVNLKLGLLQEVKYCNIKILLVLNGRFCGAVN